jgi:hypothetical protein
MLIPLSYYYLQGGQRPNLLSKSGTGSPSNALKAISMSGIGSPSCATLLSIFTPFSLIAIAASAC